VTDFAVLEPAYNIFFVPSHALLRHEMARRGSILMIVVRAWHCMGVLVR